MMSPQISMELAAVVSGNTREVVGDTFCPHSEKTPEFLAPKQWTWSFCWFGVSSAGISHE